MPNKYTIKDIAERAGVSIGTVDRVIHERGKVSPEAMEKIKKVIHELNYTPNPIARTLKHNRKQKLAVILPNPTVDPYWIPCQRQIESIKSEFHPFNIDMHTHFFDPFDQINLDAMKKSVIDSKPDAVVIAPIFEGKDRCFLQDIIDNETPVAYINNTIDLEENHQECFFGQDLQLSGRIAASLILQLLPNHHTTAIVHIDEDYLGAKHFQDKEKGFRDYFLEKNCNSIINKAFAGAGFVDQFSSFLHNHPEIQSIFVTNSKSYKVAEVLESLQLDNPVLIGYDLISRNIDFLKKGYIRFLLHQNPGLQISKALRAIIDHLLFAKVLPDRRFLPIDIVNAENVDTYQ